MNTDVFFAGLNANQIEAVKSTEGYVKVIAGAGSGKTKVLANRYAYILEGLGISPQNILCISFTNRAAAEMKLRIHKVLIKEPVNDFICTFHSFCVKILREDIHRLRYPKTFSIVDTEDQKAILRESYENLRITSSDITYKNMIEAIKKYKFYNPYIDQLIVPSTAILAPKESDLQTKIIFEYIKIQKKSFT